MATGTGLTGTTSVVMNLAFLDALDLSGVRDVLNIAAGHTWTYGIGANQANVLFHKSDSTDDTGKTIDVYSGGSLVDAFGNALTMEALKLLFVRNTHDTLTLELLGTSVTGLDVVADPSDIVELHPNGVFLWTCPTAAGLDTTTNKDLKFAAKTAGTITYDYVLMGLD